MLLKKNIYELIHWCELGPQHERFLYFIKMLQLLSVRVNKEVVFNQGPESEPRETRILYPSPYPLMGIMQDFLEFLVKTLRISHFIMHHGIILRHRDYVFLN